MSDPAAGFRQFDEAYDLWFDGVPRNYYAICATQRCGSHYLGHLLYATGKMGYPLEYFHAPHLERWTELSGKREVRDVFAYVESRRTSPNGCFGLKMHYQLFADAMTLYGFDELFPQCKFVLIERDDLLGQAISLSRAHQTGQWISMHKATGSAAYDFRAIDRAMTFIIEQKASWQRMFAMTGREYLRLTYEELLNDPAKAVSAVAQYLNVGHVEIDWDRVLPRRQADEQNEVWRQRFIDEVRQLPAGRWCATTSVVHEGS